MKVFLSYSRKDEKFVERLDKRLTSLGYDTWIDKDSMTGSQVAGMWKPEVVKAIGDADALALILSPNSTTSGSVRRELAVASEKGTRVVPVKYKPCELPDDFIFDLAGVQYVDFSEQTFDDGVGRLATQLGPTEVVIVTPDPWWRRLADAASRRPWASIATLVLVVAAGGFLLTRCDDSGDEPVVSGSTTPVGAEAATAVVAEWAQATSDRDFETAARLQTGVTASDLEVFYGAADNPTRMISVTPYVAGAEPLGDLWQLDGAFFALDFAPEPETRTHVICATWTVDVAAGTAALATGADDFTTDEIPPDEFAQYYDEICTGQ